MLFWPEISAYGVFFNFDKERIPKCPPPRDSYYMYVRSLLIYENALTLLQLTAVVLYQSRIQSHNGTELCQAMAMPGIVLMPDTAGEGDATSVLLAILWTSHGFVSILHHRRSLCFYSNTCQCFSAGYC